METPSEHSMASGLPLQARLPLDATLTSGNFSHFPMPQLVDHRIQQAEREAKFWKQKGLLAQTQRMQEEHLNIQEKKKVKKVKEKLTKS